MAWIWVRARRDDDPHRQRAQHEEEDEPEQERWAAAHGHGEDGAPHPEDEQRVHEGDGQVGQHLAHHQLARPDRRGDEGFEHMRFLLAHDGEPGKNDRDLGEDDAHDAGHHEGRGVALGVVEQLGRELERQRLGLAREHAVFGPPAPSCSPTRP